MSAKNNAPFVVCGVGVPTGDPTPLRPVFEGIDASGSMSLIVQRAEPERDGPSGFMALIEQMSTLPVSECDHGQEMIGGHVYVVPQGAALGFRASQFHLERAETGEGVQTTVDALLQNLAEHFQDRSAGIVVPSRQATGIFGLEAIAAAGGLALAARLDEAEREIANVALYERLVDAYAEPGDLVSALNDFAAHFNGLEGTDTITNEQLNEICSVVRDGTGHDFRHYKDSTLSRRVHRRASVLRVPAIGAYIARLKNEPEEVRSLMRDLLIGVTSFFRDPDAFAALKERVIRPLFTAGGDDDPVRVWVPGCGTGREAYSIGMLALEVAEELRSRREIQIFATDLNERALTVGRKGVYPGSIAEELSAERLERFFVKNGAKYQVSDGLRQIVVFSPHNLITDPPFSRMDLISCRNVLIYMGPPIQKKLISVFHYALAEGGYLFLGSSESVTGHSDLFRPIDARHRIAQRKDAAARNAGMARPVLSGGGGWQSLLEHQSADLGAIAQRILLDEFAPAYAIANEDGQILYLSGGSEKFLQPIEGPFVNHIMRMTRSGLRVGLRSAWSRALQTRRISVFEGLTVSPEGARHQTRITVQPMPELGEASGNFMVVFDDQGPAQIGEQGVAANSESERLVEHLESELLRTREELEKTVQDLEAANEELKSSNEELLSMNEELQSANEELESSKEEIERANHALGAANTDLLNLLTSTEIATIFLDDEGRVRSFTPAASLLYNITPPDIGRPLSHFTHTFEDLPALPSADAVARAAEPIEHEARQNDEAIYLRRVTPYRTSDGTPAGTVVTFINVTDQKRSEEANLRNLSRLELALDVGKMGIWEWDPSTGEMEWSDSLFELVGYQPGEIKPTIEAWYAHVHPDDLEGLKAVLSAADPTSEVFEAQFRFLHEDGEITHVSAIGRYLSLGNPSDPQYRLIGALSDVSDLRKARISADEKSQRLESIYRHAPVGLAYHDRTLRWLAVNQELAEINGYPIEEHIGRKPSELDQALKDLVEPLLQRVLETGHPIIDHELEVPASKGSDESRWFLINFDPVLNEGSGVVGINVAVQEITALKQAEAYRELLMGELNHRVKNSLATIQAIATQTWRTSECPDAFIETFLARLQAISLAHEILVGDCQQTGADLETLVRGQVKLYAGDSAARLEIEGPRVRLGPERAHALGLILHELATNASKYGALSNHDGVVRISWALTEDADGPNLRVHWSERNGPPVAKPRKLGFGSQLIEKSLSHSLGGSAKLSYEPAGLSAELMLPV